MKTKSMILLTTALCGFAFAPVAMAQPAGDAFADPKVTPAKRGEILVQILADGKVRVEEQTITLAELGTKLKKISKELPETPVILRSDSTVPYHRVAETLEACTSAGLWKVSFAKAKDTTQPKKEEPERRQSSDMLVRYEVFSIDPAKAASMRREKPADGKFYTDLVLLVEKGDAMQESLMSLRCASGQKATTESVDREIYPTEYSSQPAGAQPGGQGEDAPKTVMPVVPESFENRNTGEELEVEPTRMEASPIIELRLIASLSWLAGRTQWGQGTSLTEMPIFEVQRVTTNANVTEGEPFLLSTMNPLPGSKAHPNRIWFAFATVTFAK